MLEVGIIQESIIDTVSMGDPILRNFLIPRIPIYWRSSADCDPNVRRLKVTHMAIMDAMMAARNQIDQKSSTGKSFSRSRTDTRNFADSKSQSQSQSTSKGESLSDTFRDWTRRSFADSNGFSTAQDHANNNSRADGYDRGTRSSFSNSKTNATTTSTETGRSSQLDTDHRESTQLVDRSTARMTGGGPYGVGGARVEAGEISAVQIATVHAEKGAVYRSHMSDSSSKRNPGSNFTSIVSSRSNSSDARSNTNATDTTVAGSTQQNAAHRDSESHSRANGSQASGSQSHGEAKAVSTNSAESNAHSDAQSTSGSTATAASHSEGFGDGESASSRKSKAIYYSQIFESLRIMADLIWNELTSTQKIIAGMQPGGISQLIYNRPMACCEPKASRKQLTSPCGPPKVCAAPWK